MAEQIGLFCAQALLPGALLAKFTADQLASGLAAFRDQARGLLLGHGMLLCPFWMCFCKSPCQDFINRRG